jgi:hypothetical protein
MAVFCATDVLLLSYLVTDAGKIKRPSDDADKIMDFGVSDTER